jgi:hypothetical protein
VALTRTPDELRKSRGQDPYDQLPNMSSEEIETKDDGGDLSPMQTCRYMRGLSAVPSTKLVPQP